MGNLHTKYGYSPDKEAIDRSLDLIASNLEGIRSDAVLRDCFGLMDLTSLSTADTVASITRLVEKVNTFRDVYQGYPLPASVCVYPNLAHVVRENRKNEELHVTAVSGCFPTSQTFAEIKAAESFVPNDCTMAAETDTVIAPDTLQFTGEQTFATITFGPYTGSMAGLLSALRMDGQAAQENVYSTTDGTRVYVSGDAVAEVTRGGVLTYRAENGVRAYEKGTLLTREAHRKCAQLGRSLSAQLLDAMNSGGEAHLTKAYTAADGRYVTVFSLRINGVPADNDLGYFART